MYVDEGRSEKPMFSYLRPAVPSYPAHHHSARTIAHILCFEARVGEEEHRDGDSQRMDELVFFLKEHRWKDRDKNVELTTQYPVEVSPQVNRPMSHSYLGQRVSENLTMVKTRD